MALIEKEKLISEARQRSYTKSSMDLIRSQPEIEAIPILWLTKNYLSVIRRAGCMTRAAVVEEIIESWREECEREN